jgi:uncharacterized protein (TIGR02996 family)
MARKRAAAQPSGQAADRQALFAAVKQAPDDDAPRLVLADWLEEHGDEDDRAQAELIRVQCEILRRSAAVIDPDNPEPIHWLLRAAGYHTSVLPYHFTGLTGADERIVALTRRQDQLVEALGGRSWNLLSFDHLCEWHRGFAFLNLVYAPFRSRDMTALAASPAGPRIEHLTLDVTNSSSARIARNELLAHAVGLEVPGLHLDGPALTTLLASPYLAGLCRLEFLGFFRRKEDNLAGFDTAPQLGRFTHLYLNRNDLGPAHLAILAALPLPSLQSLHLGGNYEMGPEGAKALARAPFLAQLRELDLTNCQLTAPGLKALVSSKHFRCPLLLDIGCNPVGPAGLRAVLEAPGLEQLVTLEASGCKVDDAAIATLAGCPRLTTLLHLDLGANDGIGPAGAEALASSPHLRRLASLVLQACPIGEAGARALLRSPHLRRLHLLVDQKGVSKKTLAGLRERFHLKDF